MQLRQLRPDEGLAYRDVRLRSLQQAPEAFVSTYDEEAAQPDAFWLDLVARTADAMEAAMFTIERPDGSPGAPGAPNNLAATTFVRVSPDPPHDAYIGAMWLDPDLRGPLAAPEVSWADQLLAAAERFARTLGSQAITLWVAEANPAAHRFYERNGYRPTGQSEPQPSGITAHLLHKLL